MLEVDAHGYRFKAQMLKFPEMAFFESEYPGRVLFRLWVHKSAYSTSRWPKCGAAPIQADLLVEVPRFGKDAISRQLFIHIDGVERVASANECRDLECAAVWDPVHVEDRLRDFREGRDNVWVKSLAADA